MTEAAQETTGVKAHYGAQVAADLERNTTEQARIRAEVTALEEQLHALQYDHTLLVGVQQALNGLDSPPSSPNGAAGTGEDKAAGVPKPRVARATTKEKRAKKAPAAKAAKSTGQTGKAADTTAAQPTLVAVVREHLGQLSEPRSAAEITTALAQLHPSRDVKATVVRTTLEGLVAKGHAHRAKQGTSVFYSAPDQNAASPTQTAEPAAK